jgi:hypothetical protein
MFQCLTVFFLFRLQITSQTIVSSAFLGMSVYLIMKRYISNFNCIVLFHHYLSHRATAAFQFSNAPSGPSVWSAEYGTKAGPKGQGENAE